MAVKYKFPTSRHSAAAAVVQDFFTERPDVDTILVVNSCARGVATTDSDLDFAILVKPISLQKKDNIWKMIGLPLPISTLQLSNTKIQVRFHIFI
jgi:predicted nucleotidyltransferase